MKLWLLALCFLVAFAEDEPADDSSSGSDEYSCMKKIDEGDVDTTTKLMKLLRDGSEENMDLMYIIAIYDSTDKGIPTSDWAHTMNMRLKCFEWQDVNDESDDNDDTSTDADADTDADTGSSDNTDEGPLYTADECKEYWSMVKDWEKDSVRYTTIDVSKKDEDGKKKAYEKLIPQLVDPYYTGAPNRKLPGIFVLQDENAFIITGPDSVDALNQ